MKSLNKDTKKRARLNFATYLRKIDEMQGNRFAKLDEAAAEIAAEGIARHLRACTRMDVQPDIPAIREIIDDANQGKRVFADTSIDAANLA